MSNQIETDQPPPTKRWRLRFSLRTLLILFTVVSLWFGFAYSRIENERLAAEAVSAASGTVVYDWQIRPPGMDPTQKLERPWPDWMRKYLGPHWFDQIVEVRLNEFTNHSANNKFAVVGPKLSRLPALRSLALWGGDLDLESCKLLGRLTQVEQLSLRPESVIEPQHMAAIARAENIKTINLSNAKISPAAISELSAIRNLQELQINCDSVDPLTRQSLTEYFLDDEGAQAIATIPSLHSVELLRTQITDDGIEALCALSQLENLSVSSPKISGASFDHIAKLEHLKRLGAGVWRLDDADVEKLGEMPNLISLDLSTDLTDESVTRLVQFDQLETLRLRGKAITEDSVRHLCELRNLTWLDLSDTSIPKNSEAAKRLKQSLPACLIMLPKTEREKERKRQFRNRKWGGS